MEWTNLFVGVSSEIIKILPVVFPYAISVFSIGLALTFAWQTLKEFINDEKEWNETIAKYKK